MRHGPHSPNTAFNALASGRKLFKPYSLGTYLLTPASTAASMNLNCSLTSVLEIAFTTASWPRKACTILG